MTAYCGGTSSANEIAVAQLTLNEDSKKEKKQGQKPKSVILLEGVNMSYSPGIPKTAESPSLSPLGSPQGENGSGIITAGSGTIIIYAFSIIQHNGDTHEFFLSENENDRMRWVDLLKLLLMFPYSTIPDEPTSSPIKESMRANLEAKMYNASRL